ncbi:MAG: DoxX family protein [Rudaea sp.]|uniref:HvfX family Cu-binding RiPP maturation protein n=1 Tax=unclassified Rudaea TaxID=2627037 RepID=UPI0010F80836|nr:MULTISPECIES: DoxX family protein [unclassified Rudaea]MBN8888026.1 DoxX family protein [Rudaea sp.]MBR0347168.1 DoxX family protein [Rudaea sp.]
MTNLISVWESLTARLRGVGESLPPLVLRLIMAWEFWESGSEKYLGDNWFTDIQSKFPFPFSAIPADISWALATYLELGGAVLLLFGLFTRFAAYSLIVLTFVATAAVHWPDMISMWSDLAKGYAITDMGHGNFKLPLLFVVMLLPIVFSGPGKISLDHLLSRILRSGKNIPPVADAYAWALASLALAIPFLLLTPFFGATLLLIAIALGLFGRFARA